MGATFTRGKVESKSTIVISAKTIEELNALIKENEEQGWFAIEGHKIVENQMDNRNSIGTYGTGTTGLTIFYVEYSITMQK